MDKQKSKTDKSQNEKEIKEIKVVRIVNEQRYLSAVAINQLERAKVEQDGYRFKAVLPSMAFSVFSLEALCNTYGEQLFKNWAHFESTSFIGKIAMISEFLGLQPDFATEPWQTINQMKTFRNSLAHAKPQLVFEIHSVAKSLPNRFLPYPKPKRSILSQATIENAERFFNVITELEIIWAHNARVRGLEIKMTGLEYHEL